MTDTPELWRLSAGELADGYASARLSPETVLEAVLGRLEAVNPTLNAVIALDLAGAREAARTSGERWRAGAPLGPMDGVPLTVKDNILVAGLPATWGSRLFERFVPAQDEEPVARLRAGGAVIVGKTNVPEFTVQGITDNALFGPTRNPWDPAKTPGGSSGGAVAAVASGICPLALCTDGGGSIRRPAAHAGLYGFKPSAGMVSRRHGFPAILHDFEVVGPVARTVSDIRRLMQAIATPAGAFAQPGHIDRPLRILHVPRFADAPVDPEIAASLAAAAQSLAALGHRVETAEAFDAVEPLAEVWSVISRTGIAWLLAQHPEAGGLVGPAVGEMARAGALYPATAYLEALLTIVRVRAVIDEVLGEHDAIVTPSVAALAWLVGPTHPETIAGRDVGPRGHAVFTVFCNALGLPAVNVPTTAAGDGSRIGLQICGRRGDDALVLALAKSLETLRGPLPWPPL